MVSAINEELCMLEKAEDQSLVYTPTDDFFSWLPELAQTPTQTKFNTANVSIGGRMLVRCECLYLVLP